MIDVNSGQALDEPLPQNAVKNFGVHLVLRREGDYLFLNCRICNRIVAQGEQSVLGFLPSRLLVQAAIDHAHEGGF